MQNQNVKFKTNQKTLFPNIYLSPIFVFFIVSIPVACLADTEKEIHSIVSRLEHKYAISIFYKNIPKATWDDVECKIASQSDAGQLLGYLKLFEEEFNKYPKEFIKRTKLRCVVFVKELSFSGGLRAAVPDYYKEILFLDFARGAYTDIYQRHVIHHEFYHMVEEQFNGDAYWKDPNWAKLNDKGFKYGLGGSFVQNRSDQYKLTHCQKGFVNLYSMASLEEDKAEIYTSLFVESESKMVSKWIKNDAILKAKVVYMKEFLFRCCQKMNAEYWNNLHKTGQKIQGDDGRKGKI